MYSKNRENQKCYFCHRDTMTYFPREKLLKCSNCGLSITLNKESKSINLIDLFDENGLLWISYIENIFFNKGKLKESIFMNILSMELIKEKKYAKVKYKENPNQESLKDFILFYDYSNSEEFYEFTSVHEPVIDTIKNLRSKINDKFNLIKNKDVDNYKYTLVTDYIWDPYFQCLNDPEISKSKTILISNTSGREKDLKIDLIKNCTKYLYENTKRSGEFNKPWDLEFWNTGFNDIFIIKFSIDWFSNALNAELWSLKKYVNIEESIFKYKFTKERINKLAKKYNLKSFDEFILDNSYLKNKK